MKDDWRLRVPFDKGWVCKEPTKIATWGNNFQNPCQNHFFVITILNSEYENPDRFGCAIFFLQK
jgi:hypothetical protein